MKTLSFVFDLDDTLIMALYHYDSAYASFFNYLYQKLASGMPSLHILYKKFFEIDAENFKLYGIKRGRVKKSMLECYEWGAQFAEKRSGRKISEKERARHKSKIAAIGDSPFNFEGLSWLPDAREMLRELKQAGHQISILSSYDTELFPKRSAFLQLERFFDPQNILATNASKKEGDFIAASHWSKEKDCEALWFAVGNGPNDILPALKISENWRGIYIPHHSTSPIFNEDGTHSNKAQIVEDPRVKTIQSIRELPETVAAIS